MKKRTFRIKGVVWGTPGVSALDIRISLEPQITSKESALRVKGWFGDIRVSLEPQITSRNEPLGLRVGWGHYGVSALGIRASFRPQLA